MYPAGQTGGVVVWPPLGYIDHVYAPGVYQVRVIGVYGRSNSYSSEGYLGSRPYSSAPYPYDTNPNGSYLTGEIDTTSISRVVSREMTVIIQSKTSATIGVSPITTIDESYIENGTLVLNMVPQYIGAPVDMAKRASMVLNFFHISSYTDPLVSYANYANGYLELNYQFDGGQEQYFLDQNWASQGESLLVYRNFQSDWAADQQFIGNEFDLVGRWRSSSNSSIVSPPVRLRVRIVRIGDTGVPNWSLDHIEIAPDLQ